MPIADVKIFIDKKKLTAKQYHVSDRSVSFFDGSRQLVLRQEIGKYPRKPVFWTNRTDVRQHGLLTLTVPLNARIEYSSGEVSQHKPIYVFNDDTEYETFQSDVHLADFKGEYLTKSVKPVTEFAAGLEARDWSYIKLWQDRRSGAASIFLALTNRSHDRVEVLEVQCSWLEFEKHEVERSKKHPEKLVLRLNFKKSQNSRSPKIKRAFTNNFNVSRLQFLSKAHTWGHKNPSINDSEPSSASNSDEIMAYDNPVPAEIRATGGLELTFENSKDRVDFYNSIRFFVSQPVSPHASPKGSIAPSILDRERDQDQSEYARTLAGPSRRSTGYSQELAALATGTSPVATSPRSDGASYMDRNRRPSQPTIRHDTPPEHAGSPASWKHNRDASSRPRSGEADVSAPVRKTRAPSGTFDPFTSPPVSSQSHKDGKRPVLSFGNRVETGYTAPPSPRTTSSDSARLLKDRKAFWHRQFDTAALEGTALERAKLNRGYYDRVLHAGEEVRLLRIRGAKSRHEDLELFLDIYSMSAVQDQYDALSYCWGPGKPSRQVSVNGRPGFVVSLHLEQALRRLRFANGERFVWIDAVCINQASLDEMNHQVKLMGQIYQHAKRTIIWIGELTPDMSTCPRRVVAEGDDDESRTLCTKHADSAEEGHGLRNSILKPLMAFIQALHTDPTHNGWHRRLWCVQEFHFSKCLPSVYIGAHAISWPHYTSIFEDASGQAGAERDTLALFGHLRGTNLSLHELCTLTGTLHVGNPRDRVFSLLHMSARHPSKFSPEYKKSILEVYEDATLFFIRETGSVDVLLDQRLNRTHGIHYGPGVLPTFIPEFTKLQDRNLTTGAVDYDAGDSSTAEVNLYRDPAFPGPDDPTQLSTTPHMLGMKGRFFDKIKRRTTPEHYPDSKTSPSGQLIYNTLPEPGSLVLSILTVLKCRFAKDMTRMGLNRTPLLGRLILEYILEESREYPDEKNACTGSAGTNLHKLYDKEMARDQTYVKEMLESQQSLLEADQRFISDHWRRRALYIHNDDPTRLDIKRMLKERVDEEPWNQMEGEYLDRDIRAAIEYENLFCYARKTKKHYYIFERQDKNPSKHYRPMRRDVLDCNRLDKISGLPTQADDPDDYIEMHEYEEKARERDFFATEQGFFGLGPSTMSPGDVIVVPLGASRPFILRPSDREGIYTLIGEAIVPGIMHGEWNDAEITEFFLR